MKWTRLISSLSKMNSTFPTANNTLQGWVPTTNFSSRPWHHPLNLDLVPVPIRVPIAMDSRRPNGNLPCSLWRTISGAMRLDWTTTFFWQPRKWSRTKRWDGMGSPWKLKINVLHSEAAEDTKTLIYIRRQLRIFLKIKPIMGILINSFHLIFFCMTKILI